MSLSAQTLLSVTEALWARVDLDSEGRRVHALVLRAASNDAAAAVRTLLALGPPVQATCGMLLEGVYVRTQAVETRASELLPQAEVSRWLALRSEARSEVPAERAKVAWSRHGVGFGERHLVTLTIADRLVVDALAHALKDAGAKSCWIGSPAGRLGQYAEPVIEVWDGATWCGGAALPVAICGHSTGSKRWSKHVLRWLESVPHAHVRFHGSRALAEEIGDKRLQHAGVVVEPEVLIERLERCARAGCAEDARLEWNWPQATAEVPAAAPATPAAAPAAASTVAAPAFSVPFTAAIATAAPAAASTAGSAMNGCGAPAATRVATAEPAAASNFLEACAAAVLLSVLVLWFQWPRIVGKSPAAAHAATPTSHPAQAQLEQARARYSKLTDALYGEVSPDEAILSLEPKGPGYELQGVATASVHAERFSKAISQRLAADGWQLGSAEGRTEPGSGAWYFKLSLIPQGVGK
jgi:hypothetical protein